MTNLGHGVCGFQNGFKLLYYKGELLEEPYRQVILSAIQIPQTYQAALINKEQKLFSIIRPNSDDILFCSYDYLKDTVGRHAYSVTFLLIRNWCSLRLKTGLAKQRI